ncbi:MAG: hypothetical protein LBU73_09205 [Helicobacteraceae bacterium]|jgi:hypothetical protein|nr:hypothetical protein [Helicobacteraceae bacterium]
MKLWTLIAPIKSPRSYAITDALRPIAKRADDRGKRGARQAAAISGASGFTACDNAQIAEINSAKELLS